MDVLTNAERFANLIKRNLWGIAIGGVCLFAALKIVAGGAEAGAAGLAEKPCESASGVLETICASPKLSALKDDMARAAARAGDTYRFSLDARRELERLTPQLIGMRAAAAGSDGVGLENLMIRQRTFLSALAKPRGDETGRWLNAFGELQITETPDGFVVAMDASEPARNDWRCELKIPSSRVMFGLRSHEDGPKSPLQGWTVRLHRDGAMLRVEEIAPDGAAGERPYCRGGGGFEGLYFPAQ